MTIWDAITAPVAALPLDVFRVAAGLLSLAYFARTYREAALFSAPDGLLDHQLQRRALPFTRLSLFPSDMSLRWLQAAYLAGCAVSVALVLGVEAKPAAVFLYLLAVSTYRRNFLIMYVDDTIMHLTLFWMVVLPIGHTLTVPGLLTDPAGAWSSWLGASVPGLGVRCLLANLALVYLVAGLWKWTSPMWRQGVALHAILRMAVSYRPDFWQPSRRWITTIGNYFAMVIEPLLALLLIAPAHSSAKWLLVAGLIAFHVGIIVTTKFPFANLAMLGSTVVFFGPEVMGALGAPPIPRQATAPGPGDWLALGTIACLIGLFLLNACWFKAGATTTLKRPSGTRERGLNPFYVPLWIIGLAQSYRLFDWIDERNYHVQYDIVEVGRGGASRRIEPDAFFPRTMRDILLQSYLYGNLWINVDPAILPDLRHRILAGYARRYCRATPGACEIEVRATVRRLTADNLDLHRGTQTLLMRIANDNGEARVIQGPLALPAFS